MKDTDKMPGWNLESVGTHMRADGWTFPMTLGGGYDDDDGTAHHIRDIDPEYEGYDWWHSLSDEDRKIVEAIGGKMSHPGKPVTCPQCERTLDKDASKCPTCSASDYQDEPERGE